MSGQNGTDRQAAAAVWQEAAAAGTVLSGAQLGEQFDRSPRWGRQVIAECRLAEPAEPTAEGPPERHEDGTPQATASPAVRRVTSMAVLAVALVAAVASYDHQRSLAALAGEGWRAWLLPLSVDGLVVAASMTMLTRRRAGLTAGPLAWTALLLGLGASLAANVAAAAPTHVGRLVAAWPPVALVLSYELAMRQVRGPGRR